MTGGAAIGLGPEEPVDYEKSSLSHSDMETGIGRIKYDPVIRLSSGQYVPDEEASEIFNLLDSRHYDEIAAITEQLGINFDTLRGDTKYEKLVELMTISVRSRLREQVERFLGGMLHHDATNSGSTNLEEKYISVTTLRRILDNEAERKVKIKMWLVVVGCISFWIGVLVLIWRLGWDVMEPWTFAIGVPVSISPYLYFAITLEELSPSEIYKDLLEKQKQDKYHQYGLSKAQEQIAEL